MDYIYINRRGKKCIGEIESIEVLPLYQFTVDIEGKKVWCLMDRTLLDWCIHLMGLGITVDLSYPSDVRKNAELINRAIHDLENSRKIAYAVKLVFEKYNVKDVSW